MFMRKFAYLSISFAVLTWAGCDVLNQIQTTPVADADPTTSEMIGGLKQALEVGAKNAVGFLNKEDGFFKDPIVKIPFPPEAAKVEKTLRDVGAGKLVDDFVLKMNRGAEAAAKEATTIFVESIKAMTIGDAKTILTGPDNSATQYFEKNTRTQLYQKFYPHIKNAMNTVGAAKLWTDVTTRYNQVPLTKPVNTDVVDFATNKALDGLFVKLAAEEKKIRMDPLARVSDLLKKVFDWAAKNRS